MTKEEKLIRIKKVEALMFQTMSKAEDLGCRINVNPRTGKMEWSLI